MSVGQWVHFSIDDVIGCFRWIYENQPESIFDQFMLGKIHEWYREYGIHCDLYVFEQCDGFSLDKLQDRYWEELKKECSWLKLAWHGKQAELSADHESCVDSFERTYELIENKAGKGALANMARLHMWAASEKLLDRLYQKDIRILLTSDSDKVSYQLTEQEMQILAEQGCLHSDRFDYRKTNIRFDELGKNLTVEVVLQATEESLTRYPLMQCAELFFHEWQFDKIVVLMDQYWAKFKNIHIPVMASAGVQVGDKIYFTACNTSDLFVLDIASREIISVITLPCSANTWLMKYSSLVHYKGMIWMIPKFENEILVYDIEKELILRFPVPFLSENMGGSEKFRKAIQCEQYLWLLPATAECIVKIDMDHYSVSMLSEWPVSCHNMLDVNFGVMHQFENKLYLFKKRFSNNLMADLETGKVSVWNVDLPGCFGMMLDENTVLCPPINNGDPLTLLDIPTGKKELFLLPDWIWQKERYVYSFWYSQKLGNKIFILPCDANAIIIYSIDEKKVQTIKLQADACSCLLPVKGVSAYDIFSIGTLKYIFPYAGNSITVIDDEEIRDTINLYTTVEHERYWNSQFSCSYIMSENAEYSLGKYLTDLNHYENCNWR